MAGEKSAHVEQRTGIEEGGKRRPAGRRARLLPPAVTPLTLRDVLAGLQSHRRGEGRDAFRDAVVGTLDGSSAGTYTSYRRALGACLSEIAARSAGPETVLVPAFCSQDFADAIEGVGLDVERYDVDPETLAVRVESVRANLDSDTLAVVAVNPLGYSSPMAAVADCCTEGDVALVEALGYAVGSSYRGRLLGTFGDCTVLNFQQGKPIPVGGGMVVSNDPSLEFGDEGRHAVGPNVAALAGYAVCSHPRPYALYAAVDGLVEASDLVDDRVTTHPGSKLDVAYEPPFETMSNFQCAVGKRVLDRLDEHRRARTRTAQFYAANLREVPHVDHIRAVDGLEDHQHVRYPLLVDSSSVRDEIRRALRDAGVQASVLYNWPRIDGERYPGAASLQRRILTLPTHPYVDERDRRLVVRTVRAVAASNGA